MIRKLIISLMLLGLVAGSRFPSVTSEQHIHVSQKQVTKTMDEISGTGRHNPTTGKYRPMTGRHNPTTGKYQPTTGRYNPTTGKYQPVAGRHNPTSGKYQPSTDKYDTAALKHETSTTFKVPSQTFSNHKPHTAKEEHQTSRSDQLMITDQEFLCNDGRFVIFSSQKCNGQIDCPDGSDELPNLCLTSHLSSGSQKCNDEDVVCPASGKCIHKDKVELSDEKCWGKNGPDKDTLKKYCTEPNLLCDNGTKCVSLENRCNSVNDCLDGSDELPDLCLTSHLLSESQKCNAEDVLCPASGKCIHKDKVELSDEKCWGKNGPDGDTLKKYCTEPNILCDNGTKCVSLENRCNRVNDCLDKADEKTSPQGYQDFGPSFKCANGYCISESLTCNGLNDCGDESDENPINEKCPANAIRCSSGVFTSGKFICHNGFCVEKTVVGNGKDDCGDNSDESVSGSMLNSCSGFLCQTGKCIHTSDVCNGHDDCGDGSDEKSCPHSGRITRQPIYYACSTYTCSSGACIDSSQVCDGVDDCGDYSDESSCDGVSSKWVWSDKKVLIITASVLGAAVLLIIGAVIFLVTCSRRRQKTMTQSRQRMDSAPPPYWQAAGITPPDPRNNSEQTDEGHSNPLFTGTSVLP